MVKRSTGGELRRSAPAQWPTVNSHVWVHVRLPESFGGEEVRLPTRVEDAEAGRLVVAAPGFRGDLQVVTPGLPVMLTWSGPRGHFRQEFLLAEVLRLRVAVWDLAPSGDVVVEQRRRFARAAASSAVVMHAVAQDPLVPDDEDDEVDEDDVGGSLVDLSEGGALVVVPDATWLARGRLVGVVFDIDGAPVSQLGQVVRTHPADCGHREVVVAFVEPVAAADTLRRYVMQTQIRTRHEGDR